MGSWASASTTIDRNFSMWNRLPLSPTRSCVNRPGPRLSRRTSTVMTQEDRTQHHEREERDHQVERALRGVLAPLELGVVDLDERESGDGAGVDARARDIRQRRSDDEVGRGGLELPAEPSHPARVDGVGAREHDGVGARLLEHPGEARVVAEHRDAAVRAPARHAALGDRADDDDARCRLAGHLLGDVHGLLSLAHEDRPVRVRPGRAPAHEPLAPQPPRDQQQREPERERDEQVSASDLRLQQERDDGEHGEDADRGIRDALVLGGSGTDDGAVAGGEERERENQPSASIAETSV